MEKVAIWSAGFAGMSALVGIASAIIAWRSSMSSANIARRQALFELDEKWSTVNEIRPEALIGPDVREAVNALGVTALCWHHDVVEKAIIIQAYWQQYRTLYDVLSRCDDIVPGYARSCRSLISSEMREAYMAMKALSEKGVSLTTRI